MKKIKRRIGVRVQGIALYQHGLMNIRRDALHREVERRWQTNDNEHAITRQQHWDALGRLQQRNYQGLPVHLNSTQQASHPEHNSAQEQNLLLNLNQRPYHYNALNQLVQLDHYKADNQIEQQGQRQQLTATTPTSVEYYGWGGDRLVFCNDQNQPPSGRIVVTSRLHQVGGKEHRYGPLFQ